MAAMSSQGVLRVISSHKNTYGCPITMSGEAQENGGKERGGRGRTPNEKTSDFSLYSFVVMLSGLIHLTAPILLLVESLLIEVFITRDKPRSDILPVKSCPTNTFRAAISRWMTYGKRSNSQPFWQRVVGCGSRELKRTFSEWRWRIPQAASRASFTSILKGRSFFFRISRS